MELSSNGKKLKLGNDFYTLSPLKNERDLPTDGLFSGYIRIFIT
jgi:hypothetical protein